ncbi:MAG TPA: DUF4870 domain-containing protein [Gammaproteobacteria bacterium]|nr:DUF4870 domain-containing protein [Gammaproteobacteria bacterium]
MITVAVFDNQADAHIALGRLQAEGLSPTLGDDHLVQTDWLYGAALGGIKLRVPDGEAERARRVLAEDHSSLLADWPEDEAAPARPAAGPAAAAEAVPDPGRWAALVHMAALSGALVPFGHLLGPLVVWLWRRRASPAVDAAGREALNFQVSMTLYAGLLAAALPVKAEIPALVLLFSLDLVLVLVAAARARRGRPYRYPVTLRILLTPTPPR